MKRLHLGLATTILCAVAASANTQKTFSPDGYAQFLNKEMGVVYKNYKQKYPNKHFALDTPEVSRNFLRVTKEYFHKNPKAQIGSDSLVKIANVYGNCPDFIEGFDIVLNHGNKVPRGEYEFKDGMWPSRENRNADGKFRISVLGEVTTSDIPGTVRSIQYKDNHGIMLGRLITKGFYDSSFHQDVQKYIKLLKSYSDPSADLKKDLETAEGLRQSLAKNKLVLDNKVKPQHDGTVRPRPGQPQFTIVRFAF